MRGTRTPGLMADLQRRAEHETWMMMSALLALCALIIVGVLVLPFFGTRVAAMTAVALVSIIVLVCYLICIPRVLTRSAATHLRGGSPPDA